MNEGVYLMDADAFLDFVDAMAEHYDDGDSEGVMFVLKQVLIQ